MKALFEAISRFFKSLFGGGVSDAPQTGTNESTSPGTSETTNTSGNTQPPQTDPPVDPNTMKVTLERISKGDVDILGKLSINGKFYCYTLEDSRPNCHVPAGSYPMSVRDLGGLHATYSYRFGKTHIGMLRVRDVPGIPYPFIRTGNLSSDTDKGIILGETVLREEDAQNGRELLNSEKSYLEVYPLVSQHILRDGKTVFTVS